MKTITIKEPIWCNLSIGIADSKITSDLRIIISYKRKDGSRLYPDDFFMTMEKAKSYYLSKPKGRIPALRMIPIDDLETKEVYES